MTTLRTGQEVRKLKQQVRKIKNEVCLHWNIPTADRNIANSLNGFAKSFSIGVWAGVGTGGTRAPPKFLRSGKNQ